MICQFMFMSQRKAVSGSGNLWRRMFFLCPRHFLFAIVQVWVVDLVRCVAISLVNLGVQVWHIIHASYRFEETAPDSEPIMRKSGQIVTRPGTRKDAPKLCASKSSMSPVWKRILPIAWIFRVTLTLPLLQNYTANLLSLLGLHMWVRFYKTV